MMRCASRHAFRLIARDRGDHREFVAAKPRNEVAAAQRMRQAQGDVADELIADMVAERIVDVLEMVEIDIEHGRRCAAVADLLDHGLKTLAEEDTVRQSTERIVHARDGAGATSPAAIAAAVRRM